MRVLILLSLLLTGCAANALVELADEPIGDFEPPISRSEYVFSVFGFYLSKDTKADGDKVTYTAIYDNRPSKRALSKRFQTKPRFDELYPSFVRHIGKVDCSTKKNQSTVNWLGSGMKVLRTEPLEGESEVSSSICFMNELTKEN